MIGEERGQYGHEYLRRSRLGQGTFRILVTGAYRRQCAISGEKTLPVLEAAHIKPFANSGPNRIDNGLLLRSDMHIRCCWRIGPFTSRDCFIVDSPLLGLKLEQLSPGASYEGFAVRDYFRRS